MTDDINTRLSRASEAWARLFQSSIPVNQAPNNSTQHNNNANTTISLSEENLRANNHWGDALAEKGESTTRIYIQNVNGVKLHRDGGQFSELCSIVKETQADILCIQEHNLDTTQYHVRNTLYTTTRHHWSRSKLTIASSPIQFENMWKPGGTAIMSVGSITGRIKGQGTDAWGRWSHQTFQGSGGRLITIISVYQVVEKHLTQTKGQYTAAAQQRSLLLRQSDTLQTPRQAFRRDLTEFIQTQIRTGHLIVLTGDFNECIGDDPNGISKIAAQFELVDIMSQQHNYLNDPATYARGRKRIDYMLASPSIALAVQYCGYEPFNFRFHTDHRAYYVDLDNEIMFGSNTQLLVAHSNRILHSNNIKQVTKYITEKHALLTQCNAFNRAKQLSHSGTRHAHAERLDADVTRMSLVAESRVRRYKNPEWSMELADARRRVSILSKVLSMVKTNINHLSILCNEMKNLEKPILLPETVEECSTELRRAKRDVDEIIKRSYDTRVSERDKVIEQLELDILDPKNKAKVRILKQLRKAEEIKKMFQKLQILRKSKVRSGITRIEIPEDDNDDPKTCKRWKVVDIPSEILTHLQNRNRKHFGQAQGSPFTTPPLSDDLGFTGGNKCADIILQGGYDVAKLDDAVQLLIKHLKQTEYAKEHRIKPTITQLEFIGKIKRWRESTSTSPSGLHLGHYKAMSARHEFSDLREDDPKRIAFETIVSDIIELHLQLINYALERGYTYKRWCQVANTMIFKEPGNIKIHRTRVIHIYEADYNLAMGLKWRSALYLSEEQKALNPGQYGSRPSRGAHDPVFIEEMQLEISRLTRKSVVQINYDATSCYDRIIPNLAALVAQKYGVPTPNVMTNTETLLRARYRLKTELGVSNTYYSHDPQTGPIYGTGQGSGNSPAIWCFLSSTLFDAYETQAMGAMYETPDRTNAVKLHMIGYVDDCNGQTNDFVCDKQPTLHSLLERAQHDAQLWQDLLSATGGALELSKCSYHVINWTFMADGSPFGQGIVDSNGIKVTDGKHRVSSLPELSAHTAHKTLGHYKDPAGNQKRQYEVLKKKSNDAADFIARSPLDRDEAWTYYFAIYLPSVGFPLPNCHFSRTQLDSIQRKFMANIFAKCGFNRHTKREILFGPAHLGGANFRPLYTEQGVGQVSAFIKYWRSPCQAGKLLRIAHAWAQYTSGVSTPILEDTKTQLPHLESKWLMSLREFLSSVDGWIEVDKPQIPQKERVYDWHIMDAVVQSGKFSAEETRQVNYCRMYLQAVTLSDITNARGDCLDLFMLQGRHDKNTSVTKWHIINQQRPPKVAWTQWRRANSLWSQPNGRLYQSLGVWQVKPSEQRRYWPAYYSSVQSKAYYRQSTSPIRYAEYSVQLGSHKWLEINHVSGVEASVMIPDDAIPVDMHEDELGRRYIKVIRRSIEAQQQRWKEDNRFCQQIRQNSFEQTLSSLELWERDILQHVKFKYDVFTTVAKLKDGFFAASDGSVIQQKQGAFGWIVSTRSGDRVIWAGGPARGRQVTSYRAEGYGILSILRLMEQMFDYCQVDEAPEWWLTCDNISLVDQVTTGAQDTTEPLIEQEVHDWTRWHEVTQGEVDDRDPLSTAQLSTSTNHTLAADWDIVNEIRWNLQQQRLQSCTLKHVRGHQDRNKDYNSLSLEAQLNVEADRLARQYQDQHMDKPETTVYLLPHASAQLHLRDGTCTSHIPRALRNAATEPALRQYICNRMGWSDCTFESIDWEAHHLAIKRNNRRRIQLTKVIYDLTPTNRIVYRDNPQLQMCQSCNRSTVEDRDHVAQCTHPECEKWRAHAIVELTQTCQTLGTDPILTQLLLIGFKTWSQKQQFYWDKARPLPQKYHRLVYDQHKIGWRQLLSGRLSSEWGRLQTDFDYNRQQRLQDGFQMDTPARSAKQNHSRIERSGPQWTSAIIHKIWELWREAWSQRNARVHGSESESRARQQQRKDWRRLQVIYDNRNNYEPSVQELLYESPEEHQQECSSTSIHNWLAVHEATFIQSVKKVRTRAIQGVRSLLSYFPTGRPPGAGTNHRQLPETINGGNVPTQIN